MKCSRCNHENHGRRMFCEECEAVLDKSALRGVRLMGPVGVIHSNSPSIAEFWETGDPSVFDRPSHSKG